MRSEVTCSGSRSLASPSTPSSLAMQCIKSLNSPDGRPEVAVAAGVMLGRYRRTQAPGSTRFSSFTRIPYAKPPTGSLRFRAVGCVVLHRFHNRLYNHGEGPY